MGALFPLFQSWNPQPDTCAAARAHQRLITRVLPLGPPAPPREQRDSSQPFPSNRGRGGKTQTLWYQRSTERAEPPPAAPPPPSLRFSQRRLTGRRGGRGGAARPSDAANGAAGTERAASHSQGGTSAHEHAHTHSRCRRLQVCRARRVLMHAE